MAMAPVVSPIREILFPPHTETISPLGKIVSLEPCLIISLFDIKQLINDGKRAGAERAPGRVLLSTHVRKSGLCKL